MKVLEPKWKQEQRRSLQNKVNKYTNHAIIFLDKGLFVATVERFWVIACSGGLSWPIFVHLAKLWACLQPPLVPDPLRHGESAT